MSGNVGTRQQPFVTTLGSVNTIFVETLDKNIFYGGIELDVHVINKISCQRREVRVQVSSMKTISGEDISNSQEQIINVYVGTMERYLYLKIIVQLFFF